MATVTEMSGDGSVSRVLSMGNIRLPSSNATSTTSLTEPAATFQRRKLIYQFMITGTISSLRGNISIFSASGTAIWVKSMSSK